MWCRIYKTPDGSIFNTKFDTGETRNYIGTGRSNADSGICTAVISGSRLCDAFGVMPAGYTTEGDTRILPLTPFNRSVTEPTDWWCMHIQHSVVGRQNHVVKLAEGETYTLRKGDAAFLFSGAVTGIRPLVNTVVHSNVVDIVGIDDLSYLFVTKDK